EAAPPPPPGGGGPGDPGVGVRLAAVRAASAAGSKNTRGARVEGVDDKGPAMNAGIAPNDVILRYDGHELKDADDLQRLVTQTHISKVVQVVFAREGKEFTKPVRVERRPGSRLGDGIRRVTPN